MGRGVRPHCARAEGFVLAERGHLLHIRQGHQRGRLRLPALRPAVRHEQPARLLEHVPRSQRHCFDARTGVRQRHRQAGRLWQGATGVRRGPESRHEPPADAVGVTGDETRRGQDRGREPAAGGGPDRIHEPAGATGSARREHEARRPVPSGPDQRRRSAVQGDSQGAGRSGGRPAGFRGLLGLRPGEHRRRRGAARRRSRRILGHDRAGVGDRSLSDPARRRVGAERRAHHHLLVPRCYPTPQRTWQRPGDAEPVAPARGDGEAGRGRLLRPRALQRAGRPHHGCVGATCTGLPGRAGRRVRVRASA